MSLIEIPLVGIAVTGTGLGGVMIRLLFGEYTPAYIVAFAPMLLTIVLIVCVVAYEMAGPRFALLVALSLIGAVMFPSLETWSRRPS